MVNSNKTVEDAMGTVRGLRLRLRYVSIDQMPQSGPRRDNFDRRPRPAGYVDRRKDRRDDQREREREAEREGKIYGRVFRHLGALPSPFIILISRACQNTYRVYTQPSEFYSTRWVPP